MNVWMASGCKGIYFASGKSYKSKGSSKLDWVTRADVTEGYKGKSRCNILDNRILIQHLGVRWENVEKNRL